MRRRGIVVPDYKEVMTVTPDTTAVDSVVIGVPQYLLDQAITADSTAGNFIKHDGAVPEKKSQGTPSETTQGNGSAGTP